MITQVIIGAFGLLVLQECQAAFGNHPVETPGPAALSDEKIEFINNSPGVLWKAGRNFPANTPLSYIKRLCGALPLRQEDRLPRRRYKIEGDLPESFDSRENWPDCPSLKEIRDQGGCGSCWAVSSVSAMTDRYCIDSNGKEKFHFSAENLISCCSKCRAKESNGCQGGVPEKAWEHWEKRGIVSGGPYESHEGCQAYQYAPCDGNLENCTDPTPPHKCNKVCDDPSQDYLSDLRNARKAYTLSSEPDQIQADILEHGPLVAVFNVYEDFLLYKSGVYHHNSTGGGLEEEGYAHAVKIVGWGVEDGTPYWLVANSWNYHFGENGFFKILRGKNECGIESRVSAGLPYFDSRGGFRQKLF